MRALDQGRVLPGSPPLKDKVGAASLQYFDVFFKALLNEGVDCFGTSSSKGAVDRASSDSMGLGVSSGVEVYAFLRAKVNAHQVPDHTRLSPDSDAWGGGSVDGSEGSRDHTNRPS